MAIFHKIMRRENVGAIIVVSIFAFLTVTFITYATSIGTNVSVSGTLSSTGLSTLTGFISTASSSISGTLNASGLLSASSTVIMGSTLKVDGLTTLTGFISTASSTVVGALNISTLAASSTARIDGLSTLTGFLSTASSTVSTTLKADALGVASSSPYVALGITGTTTSSTGMTIGALGTPITEILFGTATYNPGVAISASSSLSTSLTANGILAKTHRVFATPQGLENCLVMTSASSTAANTIQVSVHNTGACAAGAITPASATWQWMGIR